MNRKRTVLLGLGACLVACAGLVSARPGGFGGGARGGGGFSRPAAAPRPSFTQPMRSSPVVIGMGSTGSGWHNTNFPASRGRSSGSAGFAARPSWGHGWSSAAQPVAQAAPATRYAGGQWSARPKAGSLAAAFPGRQVAVVQHHHPYSPGYVRGRLRKAGVTSEPALITDRSEMMRTDAAHSAAPHPTAGPRGKALSARSLTPSGGDEALVRSRMAQVSGAGFMAGLARDTAGDTVAGRYYWHRQGGLEYCHYTDAQGYAWYGWYGQGSCLWTRWFGGRWWWYDSGEARWCFYNDGFWWWQDPNHIGDLYCYDGGDYIPANSADDQILVSLPETQDMTSFTSPDGSRVVKLVAGGEDAFLYDTSVPPSFDPVYLASGVKSVQFSDPGDGRPMEIMLSLDDGSFDLFDANGNSYNPGESDADAAAQEAQP